MFRLNERTFHSCDTPIEHNITDIRLYSDDTELIRLEFKPVYMYLMERNAMSWEDWNHYDSLCIYKTDYEKLLLPAIKSLFPVNDPDPNGFGIQESFDLTSINFFGKEDWQKLIEEITKCMQSSNKAEFDFYYSVLGYLKDFMLNSDWFCIEGNL